MTESANVKPGPSPREVYLPDGELRRVPDDWSLLPPGDAGLTRRVKSAGPTYSVQEKRGRKTFSRGVWAPRQHIQEAAAKLEAERATPAYQKRLAAQRKKREADQAEYVATFEAAVRAYLDFHPCHSDLAESMASRITAHATPVGSGTVARTKRIPVERRAEAAVIAWMRHQTTAYDDMVIPRVKGARRETRRRLAKRSKQLLATYRQGEQAAEDCPLATALRRE